jgi:hypothetical protein
VDSTLTKDGLLAVDETVVWDVKDAPQLRVTIDKDRKRFTATATATAIGAENPDLLPAIVLLTVGDDGCFCGKGILGVFCLLLIALIGGLIALVLRYLVFDVIQGGGSTNGNGNGNGHDREEEEKKDEDEDEDEEVAPSVILVVNTNPAAREIHLETCRYVAQISDDHRQEIEGTPTELDAVTTGTPPSQMQEWLDRQGYDSCRHCLPQHHVN